MTEQGMMRLVACSGGECLLIPIRVGNYHEPAPKPAAISAVMTLTLNSLSTALTRNNNGKL